MEAKVQKEKWFVQVPYELVDELSLKFTSPELWPLYLLAHFLADAN